MSLTYTRKPYSEIFGFMQIQEIEVEMSHKNKKKLTGKRFMLL